MIIKNGAVFQEDGTYKIQDIYIKDHKIVESPEEAGGGEVIDAKGLKVLPGFIDVHSHGAFGHDFSDADAEGLKTVLKYEKEHGITSYCPTSMTLPIDRLKEIFATAKEAGEMPDGARIAGINMEGPFLDPKRKGAHVEEYIIPADAEFFRECNRLSGGKIRLVTLAADRPGAMDFIDEVKDEVVISLGHTSADYETASEAFKRGASQVTHLYNAMPPLSHREPGVIGAAMDAKNCMVELISDGIHIHPSVVRATFKMFGRDRVVLISDSMMATGMPNGTYELGGQLVTMKDKRATLENGTIAGSATNLFDCVKKAISFGVPEGDAVLAATVNPAKSIGIFGEVGSVTPGKEADLLLVDGDFELVRVI